MKKISERGTEEEREGLDATSPFSLCLARHSSVHHLEQLRQQLEKVESAVQSLDDFLATVREVEAEIPMLLAKQNPSRQQNEADWELERQSWQGATQQRLHTAVEQSDKVDSFLKEVGMTLAMDGATATCQDVVTLLSQQAMDMEKKLMSAGERDGKVELPPMGKEKMQEHEELSPQEIRQTKPGSDSLQERPTPRWMEEESEMEAKRSRLEGDNGTKTQGQEERKAETLKSDGDVLDAKGQRRTRSSQVKKEGEEKESLIQRRAALLGKLWEIKGAAEQLGLQEPTVPALQQRYNTDLGPKTNHSYLTCIRSTKISLCN